MNYTYRVKDRGQILYEGQNFSLAFAEFIPSFGAEFLRHSPKKGWEAFAVNCGLARVINECDLWAPAGHTEG